MTTDKKPQPSATLSWNQPVCEEDWRRLKPGRLPVRVRERDREQCAFCGRPTESGIYIREDPRMVRFPAYKKYA